MPFDAIVPWGDYVFLFECKNGTLSGNNIVPAYYFALEQRSAVSQVGRLADALRSHPDVLLERTGIDLTGKTVGSLRTEFAAVLRAGSGRRRLRNRHVRGDAIL